MVQTYLILLALLTLQVHGLRIYETSKRVDPSPKATTIEDIKEEAWKDEYMQPVKLLDFDVSVVTHSNFDYISNRIRKDGGWEREDVSRLCHEFVQNGGRGNIFDVGGNIGAYSIPLASCLKTNGKGGNRVISIEGSPWNAIRLEAGMKYNRLENVHLYPYVVTSPDGPDEVLMVNNRVNHGASHAKDLRRAVEPKAHVLATTIDAIANSEGGALQNVFAMKIDIEGHEMKAFSGAAEFFKNGPCMIFIELQFAPEELTTFLQQSGYVVERVGDLDDNAWCKRKDFDTCVSNLV
jgi:FkbM family methyltransferase